MDNLDLPLRRGFPRQVSVLLVLGLALGLLLLLLGSFSAQAAPACDRYVLAIGGSNATTCSNINQPCKTIQHAIDSSISGDRICVASHTTLGPLEYPETLNIEKTISLDGKWTAICTGSPQKCNFTAVACSPRYVTIHAHGTGRVITIIGKYTPTIDCFTITGGDATGLGGDPVTVSSLNIRSPLKEETEVIAVENDAGGGIFVSSAAPTIINNVIIGNFGCDLCTSAYGRGGGIYMIDSPSTALVAYNKIYSNVADNSTWGIGGGIMLRDSNAQITGNEISNNRAGYSAGFGGGITVIGGHPDITDNEIASNTGGQTVMGLGGGIYISSGASVAIENNKIDYNKAISNLGDPALNSRGGGLYYDGASTAAPVIQGNRFSYNLASPMGPLAGFGGGMFLTNLVSPTLVADNEVSNNIAGHNEDGYGGGIYVTNSVLTTGNNIFTQNAATWAGDHGEGGGLYINGGSVLVQHNDFTNNYAAAFLGFPSVATGFGGGVALVDGASIMQYNTLQGNYGTRGENWGMGGGVFANQGEPQILGNDISGNFATAYEWGLGGGVAISDCMALVQGNFIAGNISSIFEPAIANSGVGGSGGGLYSLNASGKIEKNTLLKNVAAEIKWGYGGGGYVENSDLWVNSNTILGNTSSPGENSPGGGMRLVLGTTFTFTNNIVADNSASTTGSGLSVLANATGLIIHNTIAENQAGDGAGIYIDSTWPVTLYNNLIVSQTTGILNSNPGASTINASHTLFENNGVNYSAGVVSSSEFSGPASLTLDYHLSSGSNAIDHASLFSWILYDIDSDPRVIGLFPDIGADEFCWSIWLPQIFKPDFLH
jgi:hypothetical protein